MHVRRCPNTLLTKMLFAKSKRPYQQDPWTNIAQKYLFIYLNKQISVGKIRVVSLHWLRTVHVVPS